MNVLATSVGGFSLINPVICGAGEPVMTEAGIRAALAAGAAGVIAKSVNENPAGGRQLDSADYAWLDGRGVVTGGVVAGGVMTGGDGRADGANVDARVPAALDGRAGGTPLANHVPATGPAVSLFNRSGLMQRSTADWFAAIARIDRDVRRDGRFVAASIVYGGPGGAVSIAAAARQAGLRVFELNVGAPHASEAEPGAIVQETDPARLTDLVRAVRAATEGMQLWVKLTGLSGNLPALAVAARRGGADAVCMMGRFMALVPDLDTFAPVLGTCAAYGGGWALPIVCRYLALTRHATAGKPGATGGALGLIGTNGVRSGGDVLRMALCGAAATELLSVVMQEGFGGLTRVITELTALLADRGLTFQALIGRSADALTRYADQPDRPGRWRDFVPRETLFTDDGSEGG